MSSKTYTHAKQTYNCEKDMLIDFLDVYQATEKFSSEWLGKWLEVTPDPYMRGGLLTIVKREEFHADILEQRLNQLGGKVTSVTPEETRQADFKFYSSNATEKEKLDRAVGWIKNLNKALAPIKNIYDQLVDDLETKEMLSTILHDEEGTVMWLRAANKKYGGALAGLDE